MQCVILAAGRGKRMKHLTDHIPKQLVRVSGQPILDRILDSLPPAITEIIMVVGYCGDQIKSRYGAVYQVANRQIDIMYVEQAQPTGTADALLLCRELIRDRFLFMFADDLHGKDDLAQLVAHQHGMLAYQVEDPSAFGVVTLNHDHTMRQIVEKPKYDPPSNLASTGVFMLGQDIFEHEPSIRADGERCHTGIIQTYAQAHKVAVVEQKLWIPIADPDDVARAEKMLVPVGT